MEPQALKASGKSLYISYLDLNAENIYKTKNFSSITSRRSISSFNEIGDTLKSAVFREIFSLERKMKILAETDF